jgi:hypothetical protein
LRESARDYALRVTFNGKPYGLLGAIAEWLEPDAPHEQPALNTIVPFVNIVANVANEAMNYLPPVGATPRHLPATSKGNLEGKARRRAKRIHEQWAKTVLGTAALAGVAALAGAVSRRTKTRRFMVNGSGPANPVEQRKQLQAHGLASLFVQDSATAT